MRIEGSRALVTGATGGIGKAILRALHSRGAEVVATGRNADVLAELGEELGERCSAVVADLAERSDVERLVERVGRVDILVANAALPSSGRLDSFSDAELDRALEVNFRAPIALTHAFAPQMLERGSGQVVLISSISGKVASGGGSLYSAAKFGLRGFGLALHEELQGSGVGVSTVFPGFVSGAGMWADTRLSTPRGVNTVTPEQVAEGVLRAVGTGKAEIDVAPFVLRASAVASGVAPATVLKLQRKLGARELAADMADAQKTKR